MNLAKHNSKQNFYVGAVVLKNDGILLIRQAKGHSLEYQWSIPWGSIEFGEAPDKAALRETLEESNIQARVEGLIGIQNIGKHNSLGIIFLCKHQKGTPKPDGYETDRAKYFTLRQIEAFDEHIEVWCRWLIIRILPLQQKLWANTGSGKCPSS